MLKYLVFAHSDIWEHHNQSYESTQNAHRDRQSRANRSEMLGRAAICTFLRTPKTNVGANGVRSVMALARPTATTLMRQQLPHSIQQHRKMAKSSKKEKKVKGKQGEFKPRKSKKENSAYVFRSRSHRAKKH